MRYNPSEKVDVDFHTKSLMEIAAQADEIEPEVAEFFAWECGVWALQQERESGRKLPPPLWKALDAARSVLEGRLAPKELELHRSSALGLAGALSPEQPFSSLRKSLCWIVAYICSIPEDGFWRQQNLRQVLHHLAPLLEMWPHANPYWGGERLQALRSMHRALQRRLCLLLLARAKKIDAFVPLARLELEEGLFG
ncbi:MAG: hypothetical protein H6728_06390 [Myxococcales bacterium]|nr:hypothetical protein [Myxococcales bacterium]MCB9642688.1 hypothetical protein [Myxococcales bacterium]